MDNTINTTPVIQVRNSRTAVKRAKKEFRLGLKDRTYGMEHSAMLHQIVQCDKLKMNVKLIMN